MGLCEDLLYSLFKGLNEVRIVSDHYRCNFRMVLDRVKEVHVDMKGPVVLLGPLVVGLFQDRACVLVLDEGLKFFVSQHFIYYGHLQGVSPF